MGTTVRGMGEPQGKKEEPSGKKIDEK